MTPFVHWARRSANLWPNLAGAPPDTAGTEVALHRQGGLVFCLGESGVAERAAPMARMHNESGDAGTRMLDRNEACAMLPARATR